MKKIILISVFLAEGLLIVILGIQNVRAARDVIGLRLDVKAKEELVQAKETEAKDAAARYDGLAKEKAVLEERVKGLTESSLILEAKMEGMKRATDTLATQFEIQHDKLFRRLEGMNEESREALNDFLRKIRAIIRAKVAFENAGAVASPAASETPSVPLERIVVDTRASSDSAEGAGSILNVDNKYSLAIVDLGLDDHVAPGMRYMVLRNGRRIGEVIVREIYKNMSVAEAVPEKTVTQIRQGDRIVPSHGY